jgi:hypothetical protein
VVDELERSFSPAAVGSALSGLLPAVEAVGGARAVAPGEILPVPSKGDLVAAPGVARVLAVLPGAASVMEAIEGASGGDCLGHPLLVWARDLAAHHLRQWRAEDVSRDPDASAEDVGASKWLIDALNARRVALIEEIDQWVVKQVRGREGAALHTETLGSVVDRLAIAWVRVNRLTTGDARDRAWVARLQLAELAAAYDDLLRDVEAGRRRLPQWRSLKSYRSSP